MKKGFREDKRGFSLVEVLVCIVIVVIICVPLFAGFWTSSLLNNRAHHTQETTAYAQETVEEIKRLSTEEYIALIQAATDEDGNPRGTVTTSVDNALKGRFPGYEEELFETIVCRQERIPIGGKLYDMEAVMDPTPYSSYFASGTDSAADVNVAAFSETDDIDGKRFPLIMNEISKYEGTAEGEAAYLRDLWWMLSDAGRASGNLADLYQKTRKLVEVVIEDTAGGGIKVLCDVTYEVSEYSVKKTYNVYQGSFRLEEMTDSSGNFLGYSAGGKVYVFARAYREQASMSGAMIADNTIKIINKHVGNPLDVYLVRGYYSNATPSSSNPMVRKGVNFDRVILSDGVSEKVYSSLAAGEVLSGEAAATDAGGYPNMNFRTNIKGKNLTRELRDIDMDQTIGRDVAKLRCYQLTVTLTERDTGETAARIETTKEY